MVRLAIYGMVYLGSLLMVYNIRGFVQFARYVRNLKSWNDKNIILYIPIILLIGFLIGYLVVGIFGRPDLVIAGILFGGSIFVFIMYWLLQRIVRRVAESERVRAELLAAEESSRSKAGFMAGISHEMRTPMNVILGQDAIALKDDSLKPQTRERLEKIDISAHHLLDLINDVLSVNGISAEDMTLKHEPFRLPEILELLDLLAQSRCAEKGLTYKSEVKGTFESACLGDSLRLRQVLVNVLDNAVKFTPAGGSVSFLTEQLSEENGTLKVRFTITDTGIGIDPDFLPVMFDSFSREDSSATTSFGGSGLGLAVTKSFLDLMGGEISVESEKGKGSTFIITVPLELKEEAKTEVSVETDLLSGRRVLVVEDMDMNAELVADLLDMEGMTSERAENGKIAEEMFLGSGPGYYDAVLMDLRMPVMDGLSSARAIRALDREDARNVPIIALTANSTEEDVRQCFEAGMNAHLSKPVDPDLLYDTLRQQLKQMHSVRDTK